jgi:hypothetical protein
MTEDYACLFALAVIFFGATYIVAYVLGLMHD